MKYIDLFGGIGGFRYGVEQATEEEWECVWYNDYDKYAVQTYNKNYGTNYKPTDITKVKTEDIPDHDCICGGFPCQTFSIAGKRKGFEDIRGTMFFEIMRIAKAKGTKYLFLENVKGLLNHNKGKTFTTIIQTLEELGYKTQWMVLNSKFFGVPQNRERVFIIANLRGTSRPEILPIGEDATEISRVYEIKGITNIYSKSFGEKNVFDVKGILNTLKVGEDIPMVMNLQTRSKDRPSYRNAIDAGLPAPGGAGTICKEDEAYCLDPQCGQGVVSGTETPGQLRRLTPLECERLQGFPDNWTEGVSNTQRYRQCGNAVTTNVIEAIVRSWESNKK